MSRRLLLVLTEFPPAIGGMQSHALHLSHRLAAAGHEIQVITHRVAEPKRAAEAEAFDRGLPFPVARSLSRLAYWHNLDLVGAAARRFRPHLIYSSTVFYGRLAGHTGIPTVCRSAGNDILRPWLGYPYPFASRLLASRRVEYLLRRWIEQDLYPDWVEALFRRARERAMREGALAASHILANSNFTAALLEQIGLPAGRVLTLPGGVDTAHFAPPRLGRAALRLELELPRHGFLILTACRLVAKKGIELLLEALRRLASAMPDASLVVVGDGRNRARQERLVHAMGLEERVHFAGRVSHDQIRRYYWAADMFALASREQINPLTGTRDVETMGRVLCEANAAGLPVVASRSGGIPSVIEDGRNGLLFEEGNAAQLAGGIRRIREEPALAAKLVEDGLRRAKQEFDWAVILDHHEALFGAIAGETRAGDAEDTGNMSPAAAAGNL